MDGTTLDQYTEELFGGEDRTLAQMRASAEAAGVPTIQVPPDLARLLTVLITATNPRHALEIGTLFGYSGIVIARALAGDADLTTLEISPMHAAIARKNFDEAAVSDRVRVLEGNALESLKSLSTQRFDFIFIDADKPSYPAYLDAVVPLANPGAVIVADNLWRGGSVLSPEDDGSEALAEFNRRIAAHPKLVSTIVGTRDGEDAAAICVVRSD